MSVQPHQPEQNLALTGEAAVETKRATAERRAEVARNSAALQAQIEAQRAEARRMRDELERTLREQELALREAMAPLQQELARLEEVAWTVDLYLGRDEEIELLRDGQPASADTPIVLRQMVLAMDEESLVNAEDGGIDIRSVSAFLDWMLADDARVDRIIPDARGVVVLVPSRQRRDYADAWFTAQMNEANRTAHWLIRNGQRLYMLVTGAERGALGGGLDIGENLLPTRTEFVDYFYQRSFGGERKPLEPGSDAWMKAEQAADARKRHYMRVMLVLQGLVDRSVAFHPLPEGGVNLLSVSAQDEGKVIIVNEQDNILTDGRESFRDWQRRLNAQLRPGMRVIGNFRCAAWRSEAYDGDRYSRSGHRRVSPAGCHDYPASEHPHLIEGRKDGGLAIRYARGEQVWVGRYEPDPDRPGWQHYVGYRPAKTRATAVLHPDDTFILPFDLVTVEEMERYLYSRADRAGYLEMVPVLRSAIAAKREEAAQEAPFRAYLRGRLMQASGEEPEALTGDLDTLVQWWKVANKWHRPLNGAPEDEAKAARMIEAEFLARRKAAANADVDAALVRVARREVPDVIAVATLRTGKTYAYAPAEPGETVYLTRTEVTADGTGAVEAWVQVATRTRTTLRVLWQADAWATWDHLTAKTDRLTGPEREQVVEEVRALLDAPVCVTERTQGSDGSPARRFTGYGWKPDADLSALTERRVEDLMDRVEVEWKRTKDGITVTVVQTARGAFWKYGQSDIGGGDTLPWRQEGSRWASADDDRHVWSDAEQMERVAQWRQAREVRLRESRTEADAGWVEARALQGALRWAYLSREIEREQARFREDFAAADDLWPHHAATLRLGQRWVKAEPRWLNEMSRRVARAGIAWDGKTLAEVAALDPTANPVKVPDALADLVLARLGEDHVDPEWLRS